VRSLGSGGLTSIWGAWVIIAAIVSTDVPPRLIAANPTTRFDLVSCQIMALRKNREFITNNIVGFVTCVRAPDDGRDDR